MNISTVTNSVIIELKKKLFNIFKKDLIFKSFNTVNKILIEEKKNKSMI